MNELLRKLFLFFKNRRQRRARERRHRNALEAPGKRDRLPFRLAYLYRESAFDLHSDEMALHLLRHYEPVKVVGFGEAERVRGRTHRTSDRLLRELSDFEPDAVLAFDKFLNPKEAATLAERGTLLAATNDGFASFDADVLPQPEAIELLRKLDVFFVAYEPHVERLRREGIRAEAFPLWADTEVFRPLGLERDIDVLFIGTNSGHSRPYRQPILEAVSRVAKLTVAGPREHFQDLPLADPIGPVTSKEGINRLFNRAKIVLGSDRLIGEVAASNKRVGQVHFYDDVKFQSKDRTPCVMASGACYLVEDHEENRRLFRAGEELVLWNGAEDLAEKVRHYLAREAEREAIGKRARERVVADYSVDVRARQMVARLTELWEKRGKR